MSVIRVVFWIISSVIVTKKWTWTGVSFPVFCLFSMCNAIVLLILFPISLFSQRNAWIPMAFFFPPFFHSHVIKLRHKIPLPKGWCVVGLYLLGNLCSVCGFVFTTSCYCREHGRYLWSGKDWKYSVDGSCSSLHAVVFSFHLKVFPFKKQPNLDLLSAVLGRWQAWNGEGNSFPDACFYRHFLGRGLGYFCPSSFNCCPWTSPNCLR